MRTTRSVLLASVMGLTLALSACGSEEPSTDSAATEEATTEEATTEEATTEEAPAAEGPFGAACAGVPTEGEGSVEGMADDPVATAASNNPELSTLVTAVKEAGLVDTLNGAQDITVFAPANSAFAALDKATMDAAMADPKGLLSKVLTLHVVPGKKSPDQLAGTFKTLNGQEIVVEGSGEDFTVGDKGAKVVCGNVQTANATVYIIDQVLLPAA